MFKTIKKYLDRKKRNAIYHTIDDVLNFDVLGTSARVQQLKSLDNTIHAWLTEAQQARAALVGKKKN